MIKKPRPRQYCGVPGCGKSFDRPAKLEAHHRSHSGERPFRCAGCGRAFAQKKHLHVHELQHLKPELRPYVCSACGKGHVSKQHHERHLKTHEPVKVLKCVHCEKAFVQQKSYDNHLSRHAACLNCSVVCSNSKDLQIHINKHHSQKYHCSNCDERFDSSAGLRDHLRVMHAPVKQLAPAISFIVGLDYEQRVIGCPLECGKRFQRHYDLARHLKSHHPEAQQEAHHTELRSPEAETTRDQNLLA